jgi:hypothetical protein
MEGESSWKTERSRNAKTIHGTTLLTRMFQANLVNALKKRQPSGGNGWRWCK